MANVIVPQYPDVPNLPGVPPLPRPAFEPPPIVVILAADAVLPPGSPPGPQWGIFNADGRPAIVPDSVVSLDFVKDWRIGSYPVELGAFASYDKVETPFLTKMTMTKGGADADRAAFLDRVDAAVASIDTFIIVMPEIRYPSANLVHYDYRRRALNGVQLLTVDIWAEQIRIAPSPQFSATQQPSGAAQVDDGVVQAVAPSSDQAKAASAAGAN